MRFVVHRIDLETQCGADGMHIFPIQALQYRCFPSIVEPSMDHPWNGRYTARGSASPSPSAFAFL